MKSEKPRPKLSAEMILWTGLCVVIASAAIAIAVEGFNHEGLLLFGKILRNINTVGLGVCVVLFLIFLWKMRREQKLLNQSRAQCREAYQDLFDYLQANCLKGFDNPECRELH